MNDLDEFLSWIRKQTARKAELYDGYNSKLSLDIFMRYAIEELGEVATAITRERWTQAEAECIDLAHCAFLLFQKLRREYISIRT